MDPRLNRKSIGKLKGLDGCNIPPVAAELSAHLRRVAFVGRMWHDADKNMIEQEPEEKNGWICNGDVYKFIMFDGPQVLNDLQEGRDDVSDEQDEDDDDSDSDEEISESDDGDDDSE